VEYCEISNPKHPISRCQVSGVRCQVSEMIDLNTETLVIVICYLEFLVTPILHHSKKGVTLVRLNFYSDFLLSSASEGLTYSGVQVDTSSDSPDRSLCQPSQATELAWMTLR
jgi:hypothetical protein